jgi:uncharacterized protein YegP (UPF0339 family)
VVRVTLCAEFLSALPRAAYPAMPCRQHARFHYIDLQRRQYQALWIDREAYMGSVSEIIGRAVQQVNELWSHPEQARPLAREEPIVRPVATQTTQLNAGKPTFELFENQCGEHRFRLLDAAGTELLTSASYTSRKGARNGIEVVRRNAVLAARYERLETDSGLPMFNLKAANHQIVGTSVPFQSATAMEEALAVVRAASTTAQIIDR